MSEVDTDVGGMIERSGPSAIRRIRGAIRPLESPVAVYFSVQYKKAVSVPLDCQIAL